MLLIGFGLLSTVAELLIMTGHAPMVLRNLYPEKEHGAMTMAEAIHQTMEAPIFFLLLLLSGSRYIVAMRKGRLGYDYRRAAEVLREADPKNTQEFFDGLRRVPVGSAPGWPPLESVDLLGKAKDIAHRTASLLSIRSWQLRDERWRAREQRALADWFNDFGATLWQIDVPPPAGRPASGSTYYSVVVPMTPRSAQSIRSGFRSTDMAEIDAEAMKAFALEVTPTKVPIHRVDFLAYLHLHVPVDEERQDDSYLLAASCQHLAFLLFGLFGADPKFERRWNFSVLCESSNREMGTVLQSMGFVPVVRHREDAPQQKFEARSFAGFLLFELRIDEGRSVESDAHAFLNLLKHLVREHAKRSAGG